MPVSYEILFLRRDHHGPFIKLRACLDDRSIEIRIAVDEFTFKNLVEACSCGSTDPISGTKSRYFVEGPIGLSKSKAERKEGPFHLQLRIRWGDGSSKSKIECSLEFARNLLWLQRSSRLEDLEPLNWENFLS